MTGSTVANLFLGRTVTGAGWGAGWDAGWGAGWGAAVLFRLLNPSGRRASSALPLDPGNVMVCSTRDDISRVTGGDTCAERSSFLTKLSSEVDGSRNNRLMLKSKVVTRLLLSYIQLLWRGFTVYPWIYSKALYCSTLLNDQVDMSCYPSKQWKL